MDDILAVLLRRHQCDSGDGCLGRDGGSSIRSSERRRDCSDFEDGKRAARRRRH